jgi:hypothetical protein
MGRQLVLFTAALGSAVIFSACQSLERTDFFASGRDARTFNPQTGRYEWPKEPAPSAPRVSLREHRPAETSRGGLLNSCDERVFNPQTGRYEWPQD